jgi:hypothetical protein
LVAARRPFTEAGTSEVWTARIEPAAGGGPVDLVAIESSDADLVAERVPEAVARGDIVKNTTTDPPVPLAARRLWLSSAGAFADLHGEWSAGVASYDHVLATGRDVRAQVLALGYLAPFGHRAAVVETSQRVVAGDDGGGLSAVLRVERFLSIVEPTVTTPRAFARDGGRGLPLATLTATASETTAVTLVPVSDAVGAIDGVSDLRVAATGADLTVDYRGTDRGGDTVTFSLPATFVDDEVAHLPGAGDPPARLRAAAHRAGRLDRREVDLSGQRVAYADPLAGGQTSRATHRFRLGWDGPTEDAGEDDLRAAGAPAVYGVLESADVVHELSGSASGATGATVEVVPHRRWLASGNDSAGNFDLAFLDLAEPVSSLIGAGSPLGGVAQLDLVAEVFNQTAGAGLDLETPDQPWDPEQLLGAASKIIGNIALDRVLKIVDNTVPGETTVSVDGPRVVTEFTFCPELDDLPEVGFRTVPGQTRCCLHVTATASLSDGAEASVETEMRVENFFLDFPPGLTAVPAVVVDVESVVATVSSDGATSVVPTIRSWDFSGAISLLMALVDKLGLGNVDLKVLGDVIDMDSSVTVPDIALGVAEIKNFAINLGLDLPLGEGPGQLSIGIGSRSAPLDIDVLMFGATFWLDIDLGFSGLEAPALTTSMGVSVYWEMFDFDIVVVSISFTLRLSADWKLSGGEVVFTGAVSLEGEIDVLGLISVSASLVASLRYESATELMVLKGTINYCVDSFLGKLTSGSVPIGRTEIELGDGQGAALATGPGASAARAGGSASFADRWSEKAWSDYCDAFAA